jgi:hypothetical protein
MARSGCLVLSARIARSDVLVHSYPSDSLSIIGTLSAKGSLRLLDSLISYGSLAVNDSIACHGFSKHEYRAEDIYCQKKNIPNDNYPDATITSMDTTPSLAHRAYWPYHDQEIADLPLQPVFLMPQTATAEIAPRYSATASNSAKPAQKRLD